MRDLIIWREVFIRRVCPAFADCFERGFLIERISLRADSFPLLTVALVYFLFARLRVDDRDALPSFVEGIHHFALATPLARISLDLTVSNQYVGVGVSALGIFVECVGAGIPAPRDLLTQELLQMRA